MRFWINARSMIGRIVINTAGHDKIVLKEET